MAISQFPLSPIPIAILLTENGDILVVQTGTPHWTLGYRLLGSLLSLLGSRFYTRMSHTQKLLMSRMVSFFHVGWDTFYIYYITEYFLLTKYFCSLNISARGRTRARAHTHTPHARTHAHWRVRMHAQRKYMKTASSKNSNHNNKITTTTLTTKTAATARKIAATVTVTKKQVSKCLKKEGEKKKRKEKVDAPFFALFCRNGFCGGTRLRQPLQPSVKVHSPLKLKSVMCWEG